MIAFKNKHSYHDVLLNIPYSGISLALAIHDRRPYITNGSKPATFVGSMRSGVGIPYDINTKSGVALASDFAQSLLQSFQKKGNSITHLNITHNETTDAVLQKLISSAEPLKLYLSIHEWKTDTYINVDLYCNINLKVYDQSGNCLAEKSIITERENHGGSFWNPVKHARKVAPRAFKIKTELLLDAPEIKKALS